LHLFDPVGDGGTGKTTFVKVSGYLGHKNRMPRGSLIVSGFFFQKFSVT
jgi:hypothetical protein